MHNFSIICWTYYFVVQVFVWVRADTHEDLDVTTVDIIKKHGYPAEIYSNVITDDGYVLKIHRIPYGRYGNTEGTRSPVLLMHGLWRTSRDFVFTGPEKGLAFLLADRGYDVWLPNARGTPYSMKHIKLNPDKDAKFWKFSWHEIGYYDLPAAFNLIKKVTKMERFSFIGVSEGNTYYLVLASTRPEYNNNVNIVLAVEPIAYMAHVSPLIKMFAALEPILTRLGKRYGIFEGRQITQLIWIANRVFCTREGFLQDVCNDILLLLAGYDQNQTNKTLIPLSLDGGLTGAIRQFGHHMQNINSGEFRQFDFGKKINKKKYGTSTPPSYNLTRVTAPVAIFYSEGDLLSSPPDAERLAAELGNCVYKYTVPFKYFNHFDVIIAKDVVGLLYNQVLSILDKYNNK